MSRLMFEMWQYRASPLDPINGYISRFTDGKGRFTDSWWSSPPQSIDHVSFGYLSQRHRHPNCTNKRQDEFIKSHYGEEFAKVKIEREG